MIKFPLPPAIQPEFTIDRMLHERASQTVRLQIVTDAKLLLRHFNRYEAHHIERAIETALSTCFEQKVQEEHERLATVFLMEYKQQNPTSPESTQPAR